MDSDGDIDSAPVSTDANADGAGITLGMGMTIYHLHTIMHVQGQDSK